MIDLEHRIGPYLRETLGTEVLPLPWPQASRLAPFLAERYRFFQAIILNHPVLFMMDVSLSEESPANISKHIAQVHAKSDWPVIYVRDRVTAYNRKRLIEQRVPFVVPGNQMYLPELGIDLREHFRKQVVTQPQFRPATQALFIHAMLRDREAPLAAIELAPEFGYSSMTLSRAFDELEAAELGESRPAGRERILHLAAPRRELWKLAQPFLKDPVKARYFIQSTSIEGLGPSAGLSALARYSMLDDSKNPVVAMSREHWTSLRQQGAVTVIPMREPSAVEIEMWSYKPSSYRQPGVVDPLSLYLSLRQPTDERVEQALDHMMESLPW
jgi:hypothetical protein